MIRTSFKYSSSRSPFAAPPRLRNDETSSRQKLARFKLQQQKAASFGNDLNQIGLAFVHHHPALFIEHQIPHATTAYRKGSIRNAASPSLMSFQSASSSS